MENSEKFLWHPPEIGNILLCSFFAHNGEFVGNKVKERISKRVFQENTRIRTRVRGKEAFVFPKIWRALFS